jgi:small subunit ribosomal protein S4
MSEKQFHLFFQRAEKKRGVTGEILLAMLERRLDNVVYLSGFAHSRFHARQLICHGHFRLNGHHANIPSMVLNKGDVLAYREKSKNHDELSALVESNANKSVPGWLDVDSENKEIKILSFPAREDIPIDIEEHLVVELYSK